MNILVVDTSTKVGCVALGTERGLLGECLISLQKKHSQKVLPMIEWLLKELGMSTNDIDVFASVIGPGSFTGLRIGVTTIKTLAYVVDKPTLGISSLESLVYNITPSQSIVCPMIDARNRQVYTCLYEWKENAYHPISEILALSIDELSKMIQKIGKHTILVGDAVSIHHEFFQQELGNNCFVVPEYLQESRPSSVLAAAISKVRQGSFLHAMELQPFYLRPSGAEQLLKER